MASNLRHLSQIIGGCALFALPMYATWAASGTIAVQQASVTPTVQEMKWLSVPPTLSAEQMAQRDATMARMHREVPVPDSGALAVPPPAGTATGIPTVAPQNSAAPLVYLDRDLYGVAPGGYTSTVTEPAAANIGKYVFYTGNWFAARSSNQGVSWSFINPYTGFSDFCCDQDVIYDKGRDLMIWLRMGDVDVNGHNRFLLSASTDGGQSFCTYSIGSPTNEWYDYPHVATTNNFLMISWNMFDASDFYVRSRVMQMPLASMQTCTTLNYLYFDNNGGTMTPAQGGSTKAYIGQHRSTSLMRIYTWQDYAGSISFTDTPVPAWTSTPRGSAVCTTPDGTNPCARLDSRITSGYVRRHAAVAYSQLETVGFFWTVAQGAGFGAPYVNNAWFYANTMGYGGQDLIWNPTVAFMYAAAAPNAREALGVVVDYAGGGFYPSVAAGKDDDLDGLPPSWGLAAVAIGNAGPSTNVWGDYNRVRPFNPVGTCWMGTGRVLVGGQTGAFIHPHYFIFGNGRDFNSCYNRWKQLG